MWGGGVGRVLGYPVRGKGRRLGKGKMEGDGGMREGWGK